MWNFCPQGKNKNFGGVCAAIHRFYYLLSFIYYLYLYPQKDTTMLNFILGPSGSGKSHTMLAALRARAARGERNILIVPEQFTSST